MHVSVACILFIAIFEMSLNPIYIFTPIFFLILTLIVSCYICLGLPSVYFPVSTNTICYTYPTQLILIDFIRLMTFLNSSNYESPHYIVCTTFLFLRNSQICILSSVLCPRTPSIQNTDPVSFIKDRHKTYEMAYIIVRLRISSHIASYACSISILIQCFSHLFPLPAQCYTRYFIKSNEARFIHPSLKKSILLI
jgi:hypothetical protein